MIGGLNLFQWRMLIALDSLRSMMYTNCVTTVAERTKELKRTVSRSLRALAAKGYVTQLEDCPQCLLLQYEISIAGGKHLAKHRTEVEAMLADVIPIKPREEK